MTRALRPVIAALIVTASVALVTGCTATLEDSTDDDALTTAVELTSEEISALLFDEGEALVAEEPIATVQTEPGVVPGDPVLTLEVLEVKATSTGTIVRMHVTATESVRPKAATYSTREFVNPEYIDDMQLIDPEAGISLAPIEAAEGGRWCECSKVQRIDGVPTPLTGVFPALDESATTVDFRFGWFPLMEALPVTR